MSSWDQPSLGSGRLNDIAVRGENLDAGDGGKVTVVGADLHHAVSFPAAL